MPPVADNFLSPTPDILDNAARAREYITVQQSIARTTGQGGVPRVESHDIRGRAKVQTPFYSQSLRATAARLFKQKTASGRKCGRSGDIPAPAGQPLAIFEQPEFLGAINEDIGIRANPHSPGTFKNFAQR